MSDELDCAPDFLEAGIGFDPSIQIAKAAFKLGHKIGTELQNLGSSQTNQKEIKGWDAKRDNEWGGGRRPSRNYSKF